MFLDSCWILVPGVICDPFVLYLPLLLQLTGTPRPANWKSSVTTVSDWLATSCLSVCNFKSQRIFCSQPFLVPSPITAWKFLIHMWNKCCQIWIRSCHLLTTIPDFWLWLGVDCPNCILHVLDSLWGTLAQSWDLWLGLMPSSMDLLRGCSCAVMFRASVLFFVSNKQIFTILKLQPSETGYKMCVFHHWWEITFQ